MQNDSPTPRTDAMQRIQFEGCECVVASPEYMEGIEKELNEAKQLHSLAHQRVMLLAKENKVMRGALESIPNAGGGRHSEDCDYISGGLSCLDCTCGWNDLCEKIDKAKSATRIIDTTNLIVLTRDELIAEIEKMPCGCSFTWQGVYGNPEALKVLVGDKCSRCKRIEELNSD